jgi:tetratricopeptide (TPR) repeat protein
MVGQTVSHYRILEQLGVGGMGVVYRAEDTRLGREVALKFLPPGREGQDEALERFQREARLASALNHPHICTIHDIGEHERQPFIVMELLQGGTLRQLIAGAPLAVEDIIDLAMQMAEALEAAHRRGIVHRDIKPANVFVTRDMQVKVLDFGLAKYVYERRSADSPQSSSSPTATPHQDEEDITNPGAQVGTMAYMSPEQARGELLDARTDLFSFGVVLFEMATGQRAFPGSNPAIIFDAILNRTPPRASDVNPAIPQSLDQVIEKAMEKDRALRYQDAADLIADLRRVRRAFQSGRFTTPLSSSTATRTASPAYVAPIRRRRTAWIAAGAGLVLAAAVLAALVWFRPGSRALSDRDSVLVGEFTNATGDVVFEDTLRQALVVQLGQSPFLNMLPDERVRETLRLMGRRPDDRLSREVAREVCQRLSTKAMLDGSIATLGSQYVLSLEATDCRTGETLALEQTQVERKEQVLQAVGRITSDMRARLGESLATLQKFDVPIEQATTPSLDALKAYTLGIQQRSRGAEIESIPFFQRAIELDRGFASAYTMLSTVYGNLGETTRSEEYARLAYEHRQKVSERERLFIAFQYHDRVTGDQEEAIQVLTLWKHSFPRDFSPVNSLALLFSRLGQYERAVEEGREAQRRNPSHPFPYSNLAYAYRALNRYEDARSVAMQAVGLKIETLPTRRLLYQLALMDGRAAEAHGHLEWARDRAREFDFVGAQAQVAAFEGRMRDARDLYRRTVEMARRQGFAEIGLGYAAQEAWAEALLGYRAEGVAAARALLASGPTLVPGVRVAGALALAGAPDGVDAILDRAVKEQPENTLTVDIYVPISRAAAALERGQPDQAIVELRPAQPFELGGAAAFAPAYLRGLAYLGKQSGAEAAAEFRKILNQRGVDPFSPFYSLSALGAARAAALLGSVEESRRHYEAFFTYWKNADADAPLLRIARAEYAGL